MERWKREQEAYDSGEVWRVSNAWHSRFRHVFECPNTLKHETLFEELIRQRAPGARVLEIGCGEGLWAQRASKWGASFVMGIDLSNSYIAKASTYSIPGKLEFAVRNVEEGIEGNFDLIFGRAILHHIDYRMPLRKLYDSLNIGGLLLFLEPLGSNPLLRLYRIVARGAHTEDEQPFLTTDLAWLRTNFPDLQFLPFNLLSLPMGVLSSFTFASADNPVMRFCDRIDSWLAKKLPILHPQFRHCLIAIEKPPKWLILGRGGNSLGLIGRTQFRLIKPRKTYWLLCLGAPNTRSAIANHSAFLDHGSQGDSKGTS
ncbi:MAG: methyltransferase domain-containing protein [Candidatus Zixiibacteriota bacterium]